MTWRRREVLAGGLLAPLLGCGRPEPASYAGGWVGANATRGHRLRERKAGGVPTPEWQGRAAVIVVGAGIAGLAAARTLAAAGVDDLLLLDLEDEPGGNSRGHAIAGMGCPLGAHYLPVPGESAVEVIALLEELGVRRTDHGRPVYDELMLCHSPQERLYIEGHWHAGLLPPIDALPPAERAAARADYRRFGALVDSAGRFSIPTARSAWTASQQALDALTFADWLDRQGLRAPALRWYLDYCCRDDYGAGAAQVSAWAGVHYFASRHGFQTADEARDDHDAVLTWPEGNAWLARRMAHALRARTRAGQVVLRIGEASGAVQVDLWNDVVQRAERWTASRVVLAVPLFVAARLLEAPPAALASAVASMPHAPWLVANLHLDQALKETRGAPLSWDNVAYDWGEPQPTLGYVDAMHQSTRSIPGPTVLTAYWSLGGQGPADLARQRARLLSAPWSAWSADVVAVLARLHPDLPAKLRQVDLMRYGHAMSVPVPGLRGSPALRALAEPCGRLHFAHSDLSAYSVFEEALYHGARAGAAVASDLAGRSRGRTQGP